MSDYHIIVFYSDEDGGWIADIPDLTRCSAFGSTPEEAVREVTVAKVAWLEAARNSGRLVPTPTDRPALSTGT
ncbi:MAG TPA: type II toxin-antitoxin system HicB family antitoxin [Candidatus Kapabacteria bacterium]|jgi:predicted RNase H-like HicB family nuclease|nr:type II toxin-antitoxin system HicB family antitoxin [Candidatus Kapabacteria bacterium]